MLLGFLAMDPTPSRAPVMKHRARGGKMTLLPYKWQGGPTSRIPTMP